MEDIFSLRYNELVAKTQDLSNLTLEQLKELEHEAKNIKTEYENFQLVVKCDANSLYGVSASQYFSLHDTDVAEDITVAGKFFTVIVDRYINNFLKIWGDGPELGIIQQFYPQVISLRKFVEYVPDTKKDVAVYGDTDSRYIDLSLIYSLLITKDGPLPLPEGDEELSNFSVYFNEKIVAEKIKEVLSIECEKRNARKGFLKMNHEITGRKASFLKKKKYIIPLIWKDGKFFKKRKLKNVGVELKKGSSSKKIKAILQKITEKYFINDVPLDILRTDIIKIIGFIKQNKLIDHCYMTTSVSGLNVIELKDDKYVSDKNHIQIQIVLNWMNFIKENKLTDRFKAPFEGQKMLYYYCDQNEKYNVFGVPDDVDITTAPNLPKIDWNRMLINYLLVKPFLRYTLDIETIEEIDCMNFLMGIKPLDIN
jgi:hypothetical protein